MGHKRSSSYHTRAMYVDVTEEAKEEKRKGNTLR